MLMIARVLVCLVLTSAWSVSALPAVGGGSSSKVEDIVRLAQEQDLSNNNSWLRLGHYEENSASASGWTSAIHSPTFFLSETGITDPVAELEATIRAFAQAPGANPDLHPQCHFKGRYTWLLSTLQLDSERFPAVHCEAYSKWTKGQAVESISLLYATGYLGNPASFYGHTLLKLNSTDPARSALLDVSVNYGAIVPPNDGPIIYVLKGMLGGYDAGFSHIQFYFHNHNYGELELRDIWEYQLDLSQPQVDLIMGHLWELLGKKYRYYFFRKNCGYRMAEILELVEGLDIIPRSHPYVYPQTVMTNLSEATIAGQSVVSEVKYHPSRQSRLYNKYQQLDNAEKTAVASVAQNIDALNHSEYRQLDSGSQQVVLETLGDYIQFVSDPQTPSDADKSRYKKVLSERFKLPSGSKFTGIGATKPPHQGRRPSYIQLGGMNNQVLGEGISINIRPSYYDALDAGSGHVDHSELKMGEVQLRYLDNKLFVRSLDIVGVKSVSSGTTGLPGDRGFTWGLKLGAEQQNLSCDNCLVARFQGDMGLAKHLSNNAVVGINAGGAIQNNRHGYGSLYAKSSVFTHIRLSPETNFRATYESRAHMDSSQDSESIYAFEGRHSLSRNVDIRLLVERNKTTEYSLALGYYW